MSARIRIAGVLAVLAVSSSGCGGDDSTQGEKPAAAAAGSPAGSPIRVIERDFKLTPARATVGEGSLTVVVANRGKVPHALVVDGPAHAATGTIAPGATTRLTADLAPGTYTWYCPIADHRRRGMSGRLTVRGGGHAASTAKPTTTAGRSNNGY